MPILAFVRQQAHRATFDGVSRRVLEETNAVASAMLGSARLTAAMANSGVPTAQRRAVIDDVTSGALHPVSADLLAGLGERHRLGRQRLIDVLVDVLAELTFATAEADGHLDRVERHLHEIAALLHTSSDLSMALSAGGTPIAQKQQLLTELLEGRADADVLRLLQFVLAASSKSLENEADRLFGLAADRRSHVVAEIRTAVELDSARQERLVAALAGKIGRPIAPRFTTDPALIGAVSVQLGDDVYDGSIRHRIDLARRRLAHA